MRTLACLTLGSILHIESFDTNSRAWRVELQDPALPMLHAECCNAVGCTGADFPVVSIPEPERRWLLLAGLLALAWLVHRKRRHDERRTGHP